MAQQPFVAVSFDERTPTSEIEAFCRDLHSFFTARHAEWEVMCNGPYFTPRDKPPSVSVHVTEEYFEALQEALGKFLADDPRSNNLGAKMGVVT